MIKLKWGKKSYIFVAGTLMISIVAAVSLSGKIYSSAETKNITAKERLLAKSDEVNAKLRVNNNASESEVVRAIVKLSADSVVEKEIGDVTEYDSKLKSQEKKIINNQESLVEQAEKITGKKVENQSAYLVNSFSIDATRKQMKQLADIKGVEEVYEASRYKATMNSAVKEGNVVSQWNDKKYGFTGEGIVVAVVDSGVNYNHRDMVLDEGVKTKFTKEEWKEKIELLGYGKYFSEKVPFGYNYNNGTDDCLDNGIHHGYHVSGIIAGNNEKIKGVAKNAQILGLKVLDDNGGANTDDIVKGVEDAVKLGADVINMSLGQDNVVVTDEDFLQVAVSNACKEGVLCCVAAGNAGTSTGLGGATNEMNMKDSSIVSSPAIAKPCLAVASADNIVFSKSLVINASINGNEVVFNAYDPVGYGFDMSDIELVDVGVACKDWKLIVSEKEIQGKIAVASEGVSSIDEKVCCLTKAGAKGIIIVCDKEEVQADIEDFNSESIPIIVVGKEKGQDIIEAAREKKVFTTNSISDNGEVQTNVAMSSFTSWGPTNELGIKPEITAPGGYIKAALDGTDSYAICSGTSMSTPFIAGSEAIILGEIKARGLSLEGEELSNFMKSSLMNTADAIVDKKTGNYYSVRQQGSGMVDVYGAVDNDVLVTYNGEAKVELGEINSNREIELTLTNYGKEDKNYTINDTQIYTDYTVNAKDSADGKTEMYGIKPVDGAVIKFSNNNIVVPAGKSITVKGMVTLTNNYNMNSYIEAFIKFNGDGVQDIGLPILGFYGDYESEPIIDKSVYDEGESFVKSRIPSGDSKTSVAEIKDDSLISILGEEKITQEQQNTTKYYGDKVAFSPNGDGRRDIIGPAITQLRNAKEISVNVLDNNKNVIRVLGTVYDTKRETFMTLSKGGLFQGVLTTKTGRNIGWDGTVYDMEIGENNIVPQDQYYLQIVSKLNSNSEPEVITMPVKVDVTKPQIDNYEVKSENGETLIYFQASDDTYLSSFYYFDIEDRDNDKSDIRTESREYAMTKKDENGRYIVNLGKINKDSNVTFMVEDVAGNVQYITVQGEPNENEKDKDEDSDIDSEEPKEEEKLKIELLESDLFTKVLKCGNVNTITLAPALQYPCSFKVKVDSDDFNVESFKIKEYTIIDCLYDDNEAYSVPDVEAKYEKDRENISYTYEGNGIFKVTLSGETDGILLFEVADNKKNIGTQKIYICQNQEEFDQVIDYCAKDISIELPYEILIRRFLNEDGTLTVKGHVGIIPDAIKVNGVDATIDNNTLEYSANIPVKFGKNIITTEVFYGDKITKKTCKTFYNEINIEFKNLPKEDKDGVITVDSDRLSLCGAITSYMSIKTININNDNIYSNKEGISYTEENPLVKNFEYNVSLKKGMNYITVCVCDCLNVETEVKLKINYK